MDLLHLVDRLEELVAGAQRMPIGGRAIVDRRRLLDIIDQMRVAIPDEVRQAREVVAQTGAIRRDSEEEARLIVAPAPRSRPRASSTRHHVNPRRAAARRGDRRGRRAPARRPHRRREQTEIERRLDESRRLAEQQMSAADQYAHELLGRLEAPASGLPALRPLRARISSRSRSTASPTPRTAATSRAAPTQPIRRPRSPTRSSPPPAPLRAPSRRSSGAQPSSPPRRSRDSSSSTTRSATPSTRPARPMRPVRPRALPRRDARTSAI